MSVKTKSMCSGCEDDFYNSQRPEGCWSYDSAEIKLRKKVSVDQPPPWEHKPQEYLSCYHQKRYVFFEGDRRVW